MLLYLPPLTKIGATNSMMSFELSNADAEQLMHDINKNLVAAKYKDYDSSLSVQELLSKKQNKERMDRLIRMKKSILGQIDIILKEI